MRRGSPLKAAHVGRPGRTGGSSKQRGGSAPAADICRERVSCKIRVRPTLEKSASGQVELSNWENEWSAELFFKGLLTWVRPWIKL